MNASSLSEGTLGEHIAELASNEYTGPVYVKKAWVIGAIRSLRDARVQAGKTQADIAAAIGTTQSAIARLEKDRKGRLNLRRFADYAVACGYAPLDIFLAPLEDVQAFAAANPGRSRSPIAFSAWTSLNLLPSGPAVISPRIDKNVVSATAFTSVASATPAASSATIATSQVGYSIEPKTLARQPSG